MTSPGRWLMRPWALLNACFLLIAGQSFSQTAIAAATPITVKIPEGSGNAGPLYIATDANVVNVALCPNITTLACGSFTPGAIQTKFVATKGNRSIFVTTASVPLTDGGLYMIVGVDAAGQAAASIGFKLGRVGAPQPSVTPNVPPPTTPAVTPAGPGDRIKMQDMALTIPDGWRVQQDAAVNGTLILGLANGQDHMRIYVSQGASIDMQSTFVNGSQVTKAPYSQSLGAYTWTRIETYKTNTNDTRYVSGFSTAKNGYVYWGFASSLTDGASKAAVDALLGSAQ